MLRPKIGLDWDDVTAPFNSIAIRMANEKYNIKPPLMLSDIESWENTGRASVIKEFYNDPELYEKQKPSEETKNMIRKLMEHIKTLNTKNLQNTVKKGGCGECQTSCQSACKTSCTVGNQSCEHK